MDRCRGAYGTGPIVDLEFASDRLRVLRPFITPNAMELAVMRVVIDDFRIVRRTREGGKERIVKANGTDIELKIALLIVKELNPLEVLNTEEEALLRGVDRKTAAVMRARGDLVAD